MNDLIAELQRNLGPDAMQVLSRAVGEDEEKVEKASSASIPLLLQALARNASTDDGAQSLYTALREDHDGSVMNDLPSLAQNPQAFDGGAILGHIFGSKRQPVEEDLARGTGLSANSMGTLLQILAPIVMGMIGRNDAGQNVVPNDLSNLLGAEVEQAEQRQPGLLGNLSRILDRNADGSVMDDLQNLAGGVCRATVRRSVHRVADRRKPRGEPGIRTERTRKVHRGWMNARIGGKPTAGTNPLKSTFPIITQIWGT